MNILQTIRRTAKQNPERVAVQSKGMTLTYGQLEEKSNRLAGWLVTQYGESKKPVIVYGHKSPYMLVCFLACVKSGRAYCPQDVSVPDSRVGEIVESVNPDTVFVVEGDLDIESNCTINSKKLKDIIEQSEPLEDVISWVKAEDVFYIIFTSGSTGKPKGVQITTDNLNHYLDWSVNLGTSSEDKENQNFMNQAPFSFDLSVMDLYTCLASGGTLWTMDKEAQSDYGKMFEYFKDSDINVWVSTPSFADMCLSDPGFSKDLLPNLEVFLFCGEILTTKTAEKLLDRFKGAKVINTYGPTESTVAVSDVEITKSLLDEIIEQGKSLPVGKAKPGTRIEIWNEEGERVSDGERGEIIIIGDTVSCGYYQNPQMTEKSFFTHEGERGYHTGDAGYLIDGQLYYGGRIDLQIKLHGYRIELEDIENNLTRLPQIEKAIIIPNEKDGKIRSLTAVVTGNLENQSERAFGKKIKEDLKAFLPDYMVPKKIKVLDEFPMNQNGKINRKAIGGMLS
ncbi:MAG: D-alanine--poly(phosphoribitol) ligase subunit DltA [Anaerostipes sp.]|nr:D-alanine--poly(phosphoribitol) ligase subunit DltA [Anaerostipes sp.]